MASELGKLALSSRPALAQVWIDGKNTGLRTPVPISNAIPLRPGRHVLVLKLDGRSVRQEFVAEEGELLKMVGIEIPEKR